MKPKYQLPELPLLTAPYRWVARSLDDDDCYWTMKAAIEIPFRFRVFHRVKRQPVIQQTVALFRDESLNEMFLENYWRNK